MVKSQHNKRDSETVQNDKSILNETMCSPHLKHKDGMWKWSHQTSIICRNKEWAAAVERIFRDQNNSLTMTIMFFIVKFVYYIPKKSYQITLWPFLKPYPIHHLHPKKRQPWFDVEARLAATCNTIGLSNFKRNCSIPLSNFPLLGQAIFIVLLWEHQMMWRTLALIPPSLPYPSWTLDAFHKNPNPKPVHTN